MTDERPKPRYGELAPEGWSWTPPQAESEGQQEVITEPPAGPSAERRGTKRRGDFWVTIALLGLGIFYTSSSVPGYFSLGQMLSQYFAQQGLGEFTALATADRAGQIAGITQIVVMLAAIAISVLLLRAGRISFYVPLIAGAIAFITSLICISVALLADPAILELATVAPTT